MKFRLPLRSDATGQFFNNAAANLNRQDVRPEVTSNRLREVKDDIAIILDRDMTGLGQRKHAERSMARAKKEEMNSGPKNVTILNSTTTPSSALIKVKLTADDRFLGHEVTKSHPSDDIRVTIDKQPAAPFVYQPPVNFASLRTISPSPPPTIIRSEVRSPTPPPVVSPQQVRLAPEPVVVTPVKRKTPTKSRIATGKSSLEEFRSPVRTAEPVRVEQEIQRSFIPVSSIRYSPLTSKPKEALTVIAEPPPPEPVKVPKQLEERRRNVFYNEQRNPYFINPETKATFLGGTEVKGFDAGDCRLC